jgi:hypothetical protein
MPVTVGIFSFCQPGNREVAAIGRLIPLALVGEVTLHYAEHLGTFLRPNDRAGLHYEV